MIYINNKFFSSVLSNFVGIRGDGTTDAPAYQNEPYEITSISDV